MSDNGTTRFTRSPVVPPSRPATTGSTVTIACKLPHGIILRVFQWESYTELMRDGTVREAKRAIPVPDMQFVVRGTWTASGGAAFNLNNVAQDLMPGGFAITTGCPKDLWDRWYEQNKSSLLVTNNIIFASSSSVVEKAREHAGVVSGMEPIDRSAPGARLPGGVDRRLKLGILEQGENR